MADLIIRGMEIPTNVDDCPLNTFGFCNLAQDSTHTYCIGDSRPEWCPLVPLPEGHGRLIDADALGDFPHNISFCDEGDVENWIASAPTIIPAEGGTDNGS